MKSKCNVMILHNKVDNTACKDEADVLLQVEAVCKALQELGYNAEKQDFEKDLNSLSESLVKTNPLFVFNLIEVVSGKSRLSYIIPSILEVLDIKYTGCAAEAIITASNKLATKKQLIADGVLTPPWITSGEEHGFVQDDTYIIKPVYEDGSVGLCQSSVITAKNLAQLRSVLSKAEKSDTPLFAEKYIDGREISVAMLGQRDHPLVLQPGEIKFIGYDESDRLKILDYRAKWEEESFEYANTIPTNSFDKKDTALLEKLKEIALYCWHSFGLNGYARVDFRVDSKGNCWVLEINPNPCITPGVGFVKAAESCGLNYTEMIKLLITAL